MTVWSSADNISTSATPNIANKDCRKGLSKTARAPAADDEGDGAEDVGEAFSEAVFCEEARIETKAAERPNRAASAIENKKGPCNSKGQGDQNR